MNGIAICLLLLVMPGWGGDQPLDKSGTSGSKNDPMLAKMPEKQGPARAGSFLSEREGFRIDFNFSRRKTFYLLYLCQFYLP